MDSPSSSSSSSDLLLPTPIDYKYYILFHTIKTRPRRDNTNLVEIIHVALKVLDAKSLVAIESFESFVRPSIITQFARAISRDILISYEDTVEDFSTILERIVKNFEWAFRKGLILTFGNTISEDVMTQYKIEKSMKKSNLPSSTDMSLFSESCNLIDFYDYTDKVYNLSEEIHIKAEEMGLQVIPTKYCDLLQLLLPSIIEDVAGGRMDVLKRVPFVFTPTGYKLKFPDDEKKSTSKACCRALLEEKDDIAGLLPNAS